MFIVFTFPPDSNHAILQLISWLLRDWCTVLVCVLYEVDTSLSDRVRELKNKEAKTTPSPSYSASH